MKKVLKIIGIIALLIMILLSPFAYFGYKMNEAFKPRTDLNDYASILAKRRNGGYKPAFFPEEIDVNAEKAAYFYQPGVMQGGPFLALRLKYKNADEIPIWEVVKTYKTVSLKDLRNHTDSSRRMPPFTENWKLNWDELEDLDKTYTIYLQGSDLEDIAENWNHNELSYVAISKESGEIFYFYSEW